MRRLIFWLGYLALVLVIGLGVIAIRFLNAAGAFATVTPVHPGACVALAKVPGAEDLQIDRANRLMFVSVRDWRENPAKPNPADGLYVMNLDQKQLGLARLTPPSPEFHPHGLSLTIAPDGARTLMVINHPDPTKSTVEIYDVAITGSSVTLHHRASVSSTQFTMLNDLVAVGPSQFYVANQSSKRTQLGQLFETVLLQPGAIVLYYDGQMPKVIARDLTLTAGINASPDYSKIYVSDSLRKRIVTLEGNPLAGFSETNEISVPGNPDNIDVDEAGNLWVASHLKGLKLSNYASHPDQPSPAAIYELSANGGRLARAKPIYVDKGSELGSATVGAAFDGHLYIGTVYDTKILDCALR
ncbi:MAG: SMP-30/gluconolactonase/LRE family protein [Alphaproteobacteria bacterium]